MNLQNRFFTLVEKLIEYITLLSSILINCILVTRSDGGPSGQVTSTRFHHILPGGTKVRVLYQKGHAKIYLSVPPYNLPIPPCNLPALAYNLSIPLYNLSIPSSNLPILPFNLSFLPYNLSIPSSNLSISPCNLPILSSNIPVLSYNASTLPSNLSFLSICTSILRKG